MLRSLKFLPAVLLISGVSALMAEPAEAGGGCRGLPSTEGTGTEVQMRGTCFTPTVLHVAAGSTVTWTNGSAEPHNVAGATLEWGNYNELRNGGTVRYAFEKPGTYPYYCFVHNGMIGAIIVGDGVSAAAAVPVSEQRLANGPAAAAAASQAQTEPVPARVAAAGAADEPGDSNALMFSAIGAVVGAAVVAAGFTARRFRR